ncbi:MAG: MMPL family transporter [Sphaerochaeta sp.]|nr:MMPL family transporter [Sphaerochaeta sp.]
MNKRITKDWLLIAGALLVTILSLLQIGKLRIDSSTDAFIPERSKVVQTNHEIEAAFGSLDMIVLSLSTDEPSILTTSNLSILETLTNSIAAMDGVAFVSSLTNTEHLGSSAEGLLVEKLYEGTGEDALLHLETRLEEWPEIYIGNLISEDDTMASIIIEASLDADLEQLLFEIQTLVASYTSNHIQFSLIGLPVVTQAIEDSLLQDLAILIPIVGFLIILLLYLSFGRFIPVVLALTCLVFSSSLMVGIMALLHVTFTMATMLVPVLLLIVGSAYTIHILSHFYEEEHLDSAEHINNVVKKNRRPLLMAGATTAAGFLAQLTSPLLPFRTFGILCSLGVLVSLLASLHILPAMLRLAYPHGVKKVRNHEMRRHLDPSKALDHITKRGKIPLLVLSLVFIISTVVLLPTIKSGTNMLKFFRPSSSLVQDTNLFNEKMQGSGILTVMITSDSSSSVLSPQFLTALDTISFGLEQKAEVGKVQTIVPFIKRMNEILGTEEESHNTTTSDFDFFGSPSLTEEPIQEEETFHDARENLYEIPSDPEKYGLESEEDLINLITQYLLLYSGNLSKFINDPLEPDALLVTISLNNTETEYLRTIKDEIETSFSQIIPSSWNLVIGGGEAVSLELTDLVTKSQIYSLIGALLIVFLLVFILYRSLSAACFALIPCLYALMGIFLSMALLGIELDIITSLLASLAIGIGVDYAIHFLSAYQRLSLIFAPDKVVYEVMKTTGKAILINAASVTLGFLGLLFSHFTPISRMGLLFCISMVCASLSSLTVLPALLQYHKPAFIKQKTKETQLLSRRISP